MSPIAKIQSFFSTSRRISLGLAALKFVRAFLSLYAVILSAKYFGTSVERDTWVLAGSVVVILTQLMFGPINEIFRAKFIHIRAEEGEEKALASTNSLIYAIIGISLVIIVVAELFPGLLSTLFAPGFNDTERAVLSQMLRWVIPTLLLNEITLIWISVLNAYHSYFIPDMYSLISGIINVLCIILLAPYMGIYSLLVANYIGTAILAAILVKALSRVDRRILSWSAPRWDLLKPFIVTSIPFYLAFIVGNAQMAIERMLSTMLGVGNVSVLDYARRFVDMPSSVIIGVITTMLTPILAELFIHDKQAEFHRETIKFLRLLMLGLIPFVVLGVACSKELVELLLVRGSFKREYVEITARSLGFFCLGTVGYIFYAVGSQAVIAQKRGSLYALVGTVTTAAGIVLNLSLFKHVGLVVFPVSSGITLFLAGIYMIFGHRYDRRELLGETAKMLAMLLLVLAITLAIRGVTVQYMFQAVADVKLHDLLVVLTTALCGNIVYLVIMYLGNLEELHGIRRYIAGKL